MKTLLNFYKAYNQWLSSGAPEDKPFSRKRGLCWNLVYGYAEEGSNLLEEMIDQFEKAGLNTEYPFDLDMDMYTSSSKVAIIHKNPKRVKWVKDKLKEEV